MLETKIFKLFLLSYVVACANCLYPMQTRSKSIQELPKNVYREAATRYLEEAEKVGPAKDWSEFLERRIEKARSNNAEEREKEAGKFLNSDLIFLYAMNHLETSPVARAVYYYSETVQDLAGLALRKKLGCFTQNKEEFETRLSAEWHLEQVSEEAYAVRAAQVLEGCSLSLKDLKLQASAHFAQAVFDVLDERSSQ